MLEVFLGLAAGSGNEQGRTLSIGKGTEDPRKQEPGGEGVVELEVLDSSMRFGLTGLSEV